MKSVCVFCGSASGKGASHLLAAQSLAKEMALRNLSLVYGGGNIGIMGELANTALNYNVRVTGVIPGLLVDKEAALHEVDELIIVSTMHERKAKMSELSDVFLAMSGGIGTLEELFEVWTWKQLGIHSKPIGLLNVDGYFDHLLKFLSDAVEKGFLGDHVFDMLAVSDSAGELLDKLSEMATHSESGGDYEVT
ncbi:MAG: TIGR00730 family Rossman fold protein [Ignavibacteria bacterium]|nr:TIGR00730 family Rossman fold protein [Ignavibacteria bacterium]